MTRMKKLASLLLAMVMALALAVPALAAEGEDPIDVIVTIDKEKGEGHSFTAYQIFTGAPSDEGSLKETTIKWAEGVDPTKLLAALQANETFGNLFVLPEGVEVNSDEGAQEIAEILYENFMDKGAYVAQTTTLASVIGKSGAFSVREPMGTNGGTVKSGWCLIVDGLGKDDQNPAYLLRQFTVSNPPAIAPKAGKPSVKKEVKNVDAEDDNWSDAAVSDIGQEIEFRLMATLPDNFDVKYLDKADAYFNMIFHDRQGDGFNAPTDVHVYIYDKSAIEGGTLKSGAAFKYELTASQFDVINDPTSHMGTNHQDCTFEVSVPHVEKLEDAHAGDMIVVVYKTSLKEGATLGDAGNLNTVWLQCPDSDENEDNNKVYNVQLVVNKVGPDGETALPGAVFTLYKAILDDDGNIITNEKGEITLEESVDLDSAQVLGQDADGNSLDISTFTWENLKSGTYVLFETKTPPAGDDGAYNPIDPIVIVVGVETGTMTEDTNAAKLTVTVDQESGFTYDPNTGSVSNTIKNVTGIQLPEAGGIGTTIFYILGGILVVGAAVLLITKRRMGASEE